MRSNDLLERPGREHPEGGPTFDLVPSKLRCPQARPGTVRRSSLIERLRQDDARPIVSVVAPAGYGKTTLLSQWAERNGQAVAWVSVDERDNDPKVLLTYVATALDAVEPVGRRVFDALTSPVSSVPGSVVPRLAAALAARTSPVVLVLDDVHLLRNSECRAALSVLADHVPAGSRLVLAGRAEPPLRVARLRAEGKITEIGPDDLSLTRKEASALLRAAELTVGEDEMAELHRRTEGWAAGLYLAALAIREGGLREGAGGSLRGGDRFVSEYVESEFLARISEQQRAFLTRTAVLERMSGPLCEAVLELPGSAATLAELARSNLLFVPLDRRGQWYRYHHLFRDMLLAELERLQLGLIPVLRRRAAAWCVQNGLPEEALEYSMAAGDVDLAARLVEKLWHPTYQQGRITTLQQWFRWLDGQGGIEGHPLASVFASLTAGAIGHPDDAERWADAVDRWQYQNAAQPADPTAEAWAALLRAWMCRRGVEQMRADAAEAARRFAAAGIVSPGALLLEGIARVLSGDFEGGDALFENATSIGDAGGPDVRAYILCERSLVAVARGQWDRAEAFAGQARAEFCQVGIEDAFVCAVQARLALHRGDLPAVRQQLLSAQRARSVLTTAEPHLAVQARIELAHIHFALADLAGARTLMLEIDEMLKRRPGLGTLVGEVQELRDRLANARGSRSPGASALTAAELRLLPLISTHLSFPEIAAELFVSRNTVKSQVLSIYRKLGVSSRSEAVGRARDLGLLEG
jgi:LuxR family maltose regulon positive regulatory protein